MQIFEVRKINTLNKANQANHAALLAQVTIDTQAMAEIQSAVAAGKEVTVHQAPITQSGWTGSGYIITDPATGAGAYKISGGANGSAIVEWWGNNGMYVGFALAFVSFVAAVAIAASATVIVAPIFIVLLGIFSVFTSLMNMMVIEIQTMDNGCPQGIAALGVGLESLALVISFMGSVGVALGTFLSFISGGAVGGVTCTGS